jgi:glutamyl-tRNA synthetase
VDDFVLWRADGVPAYQLAVVVDDLAMDVTEVVRGADLADSTPRQLALIDALGGTAPVYRHVPLVLDGLAKRSGATQVAELRRRGVAPERVVGLLAATLGLAEAGAPARLPELAPGFSWDRVARGSVVVDEPTLRALAA